MKYLAAYLLAVLGGNSSPDATTIKNILNAGGSTVDDEKLNKLLTDLEGKSIEELLAEGKQKLSSVPSGRPSSGPATTSTKTEETSAPVEAAVSDEDDEVRK